MANIERNYGLLVKKHGAKILSVTRIVRKSPKRPYSLQNADFSVDAIKHVIHKGESTALEELESFQLQAQAQSDHGQGIYAN